VPEAQQHQLDGQGPNSGDTVHRVGSLSQRALGEGGQRRWAPCNTLGAAVETLEMTQDLVKHAALVGRLLV
jgi:hypothetical protein